MSSLDASNKVHITLCQTSQIIFEFKFVLLTGELNVEIQRVETKNRFN